MMAPQFETKRLKHCGSLLANNGQVSVSAKRKTRAGKVIFMSQNVLADMKNLIQFSILILKIYNITICNI